MNAVVGELVLAPKNKTIFSCPHSHVIYMPQATRPFKLLTFLGREPRMLSYDLSAALRYVVLMNRVDRCDCLKAWAMARGLKLAPREDHHV